ncbi:Sulfur carrier protein ThiS adenylyltransferase [Aquisphaera giovannonii]|uniref:Sulfur carrier protein ThiS adenylyltransferase n=1 Tax=Aquisphaera giovannonii TaxID=406548 RepID=A0A5B9VVN0_9BACT|nr:ThiF family adenylyltransferase [Aquisphaera giovannonii]QEH32288.1 Sulfur carrier protein ThiS adenylyltransferase [Aquisphaera giovannonii]
MKTDQPAASPTPAGADAGAEAESAPLRIDDDDRYGRLRLISWWRQERLAAARILVVGAGALGNEVLKNLALVGVGTTYVIDLDDVDTSNLSRSVLFRAGDSGSSKAEVAARRALELNPEIAIHPIHGDVITDLGLGLFADVDLVVGCLDNREARLWVNRQCWKVGTPWVDAGIQEIQGVVKVFVPPDSACYECAMTERDYQLLNLRYSCPLLKRDEILAGKVPTAPTIASMMAALEVQEALKILHGMPVAAGSALVFNGVANQFYATRLPRREDCLSHETYPEPTEAPLGHADSVAEVFELARRPHGDEPGLEGPLSLALERELVAALDCPRCGWHAAVNRPRTKVRQSEATCPNCREAARPEILSSVEEGSPHAAGALKDAGVPAYDIVRVDGAEGSRFFLLAGDRPAALRGRGLDLKYDGETGR